jgi:hypothetical protein
MRKLAFGGVGCLVLVLASCSKAPNPREVIIGKWEDTKDKSLMEFTRDGEFKFIPADPKTPSPGPKSPPVGGKYTFVDDNNLELVIAGAPPGTSSVSIPGWGNMKYGDMAKVLQGEKVTTRVRVTVAGDKLTMQVGSGEQEFKRGG